jgi:hypothetical protein
MESDQKKVGPSPSLIIIFTLVSEIANTPTQTFSGFGGLGVSVLASGTQVRGFKPGRSRRIFKSGKILKHAFLRKGSKAMGPMSQICGM